MPWNALPRRWSPLWRAARDSISRLDPRLPVALRTADFAQIVKLVDASTVGPGLPNLEFLRLRLLDFASGVLAVGAGKLADTEKLSARLDAELRRIEQQQKSSEHVHPAPPSGPPKNVVMPDALLDPLLKTLSIMALELHGSLLDAQGKTEDAKTAFAGAAKEEKDLGYREPPNYIRPVGETEGAAMLAVHRWADAKAAFERALVERPHSGFALYGIARACEGSDDRAAAVKTYEDFLTAWKDADAGLPQIAHAREYLATHRQ